MKEFAKLVRGGELFQGLLVMMVGGSVCYVAVQGQAVPEVLTAGFGMIIGYFFANRSRVNATNGVEKYMRSLGLDKRGEEKE